MAGITERNLVTVPALPGVRTSLYSMDEPPIPVVDHDGREVSSLMAVLAEFWRVAALTRLIVRFREDSVFFSPVEIVVLGLDL